MTSDSEIPEVGPYLPDEDEQIYPRKPPRRRGYKAAWYLWEVALPILATLFVIGSILTVVDLFANHGRIMAHIYESAGIITPIPTSNPLIIETSTTPTPDQTLSAPVIATPQSP